MDSFGHGAIAHSHSQRPVSRGFLLFKRCEWLVGNWTVSFWTSLNIHRLVYTFSFLYL